eukprot:gene30224-37753_t
MGMRDEAQFFDAHEPWRSEADRSFFGVTALRKKLSQIQ